LLKLFWVTCKIASQPSEISFKLNLFNPVRLSTAFLVALLILGSLISCSKKYPVPEQTCLYAGKTTTIISSTSKIDYGNEIVLNDAKQLASARKTDNSEFFDGSNNRRWKRTITTNYTPQYDTQGFLTQMTTTTVNLYEGLKSSFGRKAITTRRS